MGRPRKIPIAAETRLEKLDGERPLVFRTADKIVKLKEMMTHDEFGRFLDECEDRHTVALKVCGTVAIFRAGPLRIHAPQSVILVELPKCRGCGCGYLGHETYCYQCLCVMAQRQ